MKYYKITWNEPIIHNDYPESWSSVGGIYRGEDGEFLYLYNEYDKKWGATAWTIERFMRNKISKYPSFSCVQLEESDVVLELI